VNASERDLRVERDLVHALYAQGRSGNLIAAMIATLVVAAMWRSVPAALLLGWYAAYLANLAVRGAMIRAFRRENPSGGRLRVWARRYTLGLAAGGVIFGGSVALLFFPQAGQLGQFFLIVVVIGMAVGSIAGNASHPPAMYVYVPALLLPMAACLLAQPGFEHGLLSASFIIFLAALLAFGRNQAALIRNSIAIGHENIELLRKAEQASLAKSQFFAAASHDLRQPMQALGLYAASLREVTAGNPHAARQVDQILSSVDALESLFDELLDISRLDAGYIKPAPSHFAAAALFERLETAYAPIARKNHLTLSFDDDGVVLNTDSVLLERVVGNLLSNALRYTPQGSVSVRCRRGAAAAIVEVADTGIGIPREEHEHVFDEFYQLGNPERDRRKGLGLGLATVKRMTQLLGCRVSVDSAPGHGSVFSVEVPIGDAARIAPAPQPASVDFDALRGKVIAVVDDERDVRDGLAELLGQWRCRPVLAASASELIARLEQTEPPDAVIADYRLREHESGAGVAATLRARYGAALPVLIMSGDTTPEIFRVAREQRLPLLSKPVRAARLRAALLHLLQQPESAAA
jgi:signal transduction histidine kinase/ActR/RegA family two-component response regulator